MTSLQKWIEKGWKPIIGMTIGLFMLWFVINEAGGFVSLGEFLLNAVRVIPEAIEIIVAYYRELPMEQLLWSIGIGGAVGIISTLLVYRRQKGNITLTNMLLGGGIGALGGQLLNYPSQHCTFAPETEFGITFVGGILTAIGAIVLLLPFWTIALQRQNRQAHGSGYFKGWLMPLTLLMPTLISLVVFLYYPSIQIAIQSMTRQRGRQASRFVCLENYTDLLADTVYRSSFTTTFLITAGIVAFSMGLGLMIALLASQKVRGASIYRTLLIWPYAVSPVVTAVIFIAIFRNDPNGFANYYLGGVLGGAQNWIGNPNLAPLVIILASVWNALGFNILFYVAGLQNVPKDLLEAAQIDGANVVQRFIRITFPMLSPFTFFLLITNITFGVYGLYGIVETLTQGGPAIGEGAGATNILIYKLYADLLSTGSQIGNVAAQSVILFVLVAIVTIIQFQFIERRVTYSD